MNISSSGILRAPRTNQMHGHSSQDAIYLKTTREKQMLNFFLFFLNSRNSLSPRFVDGFVTGKKLTLYLQALSDSSFLELMKHENSCEFPWIYSAKSPNQQIRQELLPKASQRNC